MTAPLIVELEQLEKTYGEGLSPVHALRGVDLRIAPGEFVAVVGTSGSGKTTMMEILGCLSRPTRGTYRLNGRCVHEIDAATLARVRGEEIGFVFQSFNLLPRLSAFENVELPLCYRAVPRRERRKRAQEMLQRVGLDARAAHLPSELSGGERQRVAIARALINDPKLILADEPTGNLDSGTGAEIMALLRGLHREGKTLVLVTHDPSIAAQADRRITLRDGRVVSGSA